MALTAELSEIFAQAAEKTALPKSAEWLETVELESANDSRVQRSIVPGEIVLGMAGDVGLEDVQEALQTSLRIARLDTGGTIQLDHLLTSASNSASPVTLFRLHLGEFQDVPAAGREISQTIAGVSWVTPNYAYHRQMLELTPNDPDYLTRQYPHFLMQTDLAWDVTLGSPNVIIAVTDNGMQLDHPDLAPNLWVNTAEIPGNGVDDDNNGFIDDINGWDFVTGDNNPSPAVAADVHGTAVAGVIGGRINNGLGIAGTAGMSTLMPLRVLGSDGTLTSVGLLGSFAYAADNGARIVNTSLDLDEFVTDATINTALQYLYDNEVLSISSAGNTQDLNPARQKFHQTLLVGATAFEVVSVQEVPAAYTNFGTGIDISAPGDFVWTTLPGGTFNLFDLFAAMEGTSMAAGFVSGVAALIWSANPTYTRDQVAARLIGTANSIDALNPDFAGLLGSGRANANVAVNSTLIPLPAPRLKGIREVKTPGQAILPINQFNIGLASVLNKATVETAANWSLVGAGPDNSFGTGDDVPVVLTRVNPYLIGANDVTFSFPTLAPGNYRFTAISGGLRDPFNTALDGDGNGAAGGNFVQDFTVTAGTVVFSADFSDAGGAPSAEGFSLAGTANAWHLTLGRGSDPGHSADDSAYFGSGEGLAGGGSYGSDANGSLVSPFIDLSRYSGPIALDFNHFLQSEAGFDFAHVRVLEGNAGRTIATTNQGIFVDTVLAPATTGWEPVSLDLSEFAGRIIRLQFQFTSNASNNLEGWYLDDVTVRAANPLPSANLSGQVWNDVNGNRVRDAGDNGTAGWTVYLDGNNNGTLDTTQAVNVPATDVPRVISNGNFISSSTVVSGILGTITDLDVTVNITHTFVSDVDIFLVSPGGFRIRLAGEEGGTGANYTNTRFDDEAATPIVGAAAPFTGSFRPEGTPLSIFDGISPNGTWQLEVGDYFLLDTGSLDNWTLHFTIAEPSRVTDAGGNYAFNNVPPGNYVVREVPQATWNQSVPLTGFYNVTPTNGQSLTTLDFANTQGPVAPPTFQVSAVTPTRTGVVVDFNRDLSVTDLNLYAATSSGIGLPDFILMPSAGGASAVRGSIVVDPNLRRLTFVATNGLLPADTYTLTLVSATDGFKDSTNELLDGDANGTPGGNYSAPVIITAPAGNAVSVGIPNFARGPQQPVNLPLTGTTGIPISFSNGDLITSATFQVTYDPALLTITGATVAPGLTGATVSTTGSTPGTLLVQFSSPTPLTSATTRFMDVQASVPTTATYRSKSVLDISNVVLNGGALPGLDDDSVMVAAYFGDVSGNGSYAAPDVSRMQYVATGLDRGFAVYKLLDPSIIGDVTGAGGISSLDVTRVTYASIGVSTPELLTPLPGVSLTQGGPDPKLSIPTTLTASPGSNLNIPVMIDSIVDLTGNGLEGAELLIYFDPTVLTVNGVSPGSLLAGKGWSAASRIDNLAGRIIVSLSTSAPLEGQFIGELLAIDATVQASAPPGASAINLAASAHDPNFQTQLNEAYLTLIPAPTDAADDPIDGLLTITAAPTSTVDQPAARVIDGQLLILGTSGSDRVFVAPVSDNLVRVRVGNQVLGTFAAPGGIAIDLLGGQDYAYVSPSVARTVVATAVDSAPEDAIFGGGNSLLVDDQDLWATALQNFLEGMTAAEQRAARDLALLDLAMQWSNQPASSSPRGFGRLFS